MRPVILTKQLTGGLDRDGIALAQQLSAAGDLTLNGALTQGGPADTNGIAISQVFANGIPLTLEVAYSGLPRRITITSGDDISAINFTIDGLDVNGDPISDTIAGPNNATVGFAGEFAIVTSITPDDDPAGAEEVEAGWAAFGSSAILGSQRVVGVYSAGNIASVIFTVYGRDDFGREISEQVTGVNNGTVSTLLNYAAVDRVSASAVVGSDVEVGVTAVGASPPIPLDLYIYPGNTTSVDVQGTVNYTVQVTPDDPYQAADAPLNWFPYPAANGNLVAQSADGISSTIIAYRAVRLLINSGTDPARITVIQSGLGV